MLKKNRQEVLESIKNKIHNDMNNTLDFNGRNIDNGDWWTSDYDNTSNEWFSAPAGTSGWPPHIKEYIKRVALMMAVEILDAVYDEQELEHKAEQIILEAKTD